MAAILDVLAGAARGFAVMLGRTNAPAASEPVPLVQEAEEDDGLTVQERLDIEVAEAAWDNVAIGRMLRLRAETAALSGQSPTIGASILERIPEERRAELLELATVRDTDRREFTKAMRKTHDAETPVLPAARLPA